MKAKIRGNQNRKQSWTIQKQNIMENGKFEKLLMCSKVNWINAFYGLTDFVCLSMLSMLCHCWKFVLEIFTFNPILFLNLKAFSIFYLLKQFKIFYHKNQYKNNVHFCFKNQWIQFMCHKAYNFTPSFLSCYFSTLCIFCSANVPTSRNEHGNVLCLY